MIMKVIAYKDTKLNVFSQPVCISSSSTEEIIENVRRMCANPEFPSSYFEYDLYFLGEFDDKTGSFKVSKPDFLVSLADFRHLASKVEVTKDASC